jgi:tripartite-type tricarboxylate transporter receptor subunit TctC
MQDLLGGNVETVVIDCATGLPFIADGRVRALAVFSDQRSARAPAVPTLGELGHANAVAYGWQGIAVPTGVPAPVLERLGAALRAGIAAADVQDRFSTLGIESAPWSPAEFAGFIRRETALWRPLIRELGIRLDG